MCGIAGFFDPARRRDADASREVAARMAGMLAHRGPDAQGEWVDAEAGIGLGHRRLSILDLSSRSGQPMHSACGRFVASYNGEIYNFRALRSELEALGHRFRGGSDTEVALAAFTRWGVEAALPRLNGMFAIALWDRSGHALYLIRDRLGKKPLYYGWMRGGLLFGSELKALRVHPDFAGTVDRNVLALYLRHGYVPTPYSIYEGVRKLPPGHLLRVSAAAPDADPVPYWSAREAVERGVAEPYGGSDTDAAGELDVLLRDAVRIRMESDVPLGAFLSGGIDSTAVVALMQAQSPRPVKTFTIGFWERGYDEAEHARAVAGHLGTEHTELYVTPADALAVIPRLPELFDEPFADASQIPTFLVSGLAREHVTVSLSGDGGDELFAGYNRYFWGTGIWKRIGWMHPAARAGLARAVRALSPQRWDSLLRALGPVLPRHARQSTPGDKLHKLAGILAAPGPEALYTGLVSHWSDPTAVALGSSEPPTHVNDPARWASVPDFAHRMMYLDTVSYLPDDILVKVDRASMGVSLEARAPLLDYRALEFAWTLPLSMKIRDGKGKWLLRQVLYRYVPREMVERPKMGFGIPIDSWLRGPLRGWAEDLLSEDRLRRDAFLDPAAVRARWTEHLSGRRNWQYALWPVLMFQAWLDSVGSAAGADESGAELNGRREDACAYVGS